MSDKIVNHFVLADGSTAKYDANSLSGTITNNNAVSWHSVTDSDGFSVGNGINQTTYEIGSLRVNGQNYNISYRVRMSDFVSFPYPVTYSIASGFRFSMWWKDANGGFHDAGWLFGDYIVPANIEHRVVIGAYPENTGIAADIDTFTSALSFNSFYQYEIQKHNKHNCRLISHTGYTKTAPMNSYEAILEAIDLGYNCMEIDVQRTTDGVYFLSHNDSITAYIGGTSTSIKFSTSQSSELDGAYWDANGLYKIETFTQVLELCKKYDVDFIIDMKTGSYETLITTCGRIGCLDHIILNFSNLYALYNQRNLLKKYPQVSIRVVPTIADNIWDTTRDTLPNKIYADVNVYENNFAEQYLPNAFYYNLPVIFSGCTDANTKKWLPIAYGVMNNWSVNYTRAEWESLLSFVASDPLTITSDSALSISSGGTVSTNASTSIDTPFGWVYGYTSNASIFTVVQNTFGNQATFTLTATGAGSATLELFTASGTSVSIPVTVS